MNTDLLDTFASNAMIALTQVYGPEELSEDFEETDKWCDFLATRSYYMAAAMMEARGKFHSILAEMATSKENENA